MQAQPSVDPIKLLQKTAGVLAMAKSAPILPPSNEPAAPAEVQPPLHKTKGRTHQETSQVRSSPPTTRRSAARCANQA